MLTQVENTIFYDEVSMPEVDLANVRKLVDKLIDIDKIGEISLDDFANLAALLPDAVVDEIGPKLTYLPSSANVTLAQEALTTGMKVTLSTVLAAAIGVLLHYFRMQSKKKSGGATAGPGGKPNFTKTMAEQRKEIKKVTPVFNTALEEFLVHMENFNADRTVDTIDGDLYPGLISLMGGLHRNVRQFTTIPIPAFERERDKGRIGSILSTYAEALSPGNFSYQWVRPANYFFMSDRDLYTHTRFLEEIFRYLRVNRSFETMFPDLTDALGRMRFQPSRVEDHQAPGAEDIVKEIFDIIENDFAPKDMARAAGMQVNTLSNYDVFLEIVSTTKLHIEALFGTDMYEAGPGIPVKGKSMDNYFDFLTVEGAERRGTIYLQIDEMADQCGDLLHVAKEKMVNGRRVNFLAEAKSVTDLLSQQVRNDMDVHPNTSANYTDQHKQNLADFKDIGVFVTGLTRFVADLTRVVEAVTKVEDRLIELEDRMGMLTKSLIQVNEILRKVNQ